MVSKGKATQATPKKRVVPVNWRQVFLEELRETPIIADACAKANVSRSMAYRHRQSEDNFARQWDSALACGMSSLEDEVFKLAKGGNATLAIFLLKAHYPERYRERYDVTSGGKPLPIAVVKMDVDEL